MQDRKALQAGTSHFLGQNFAQGVRRSSFQTEAGELQHAWTTSWGVSTRLIGALIMTHADDDGLVLPPQLAPKHVVILPIMREGRGSASGARVLPQAARRPERRELRGPSGRSPSSTSATCAAARRTGVGQEGRAAARRGRPARHGEQLRVRGAPRQPPSSKQSLPRDEFVSGIAATLEDIQRRLFARAKAHREANTRPIDDKDEFYAFFTPPGGAERRRAAEIHGGFALSHFTATPSSRPRSRTTSG